MNRSGHKLSKKTEYQQEKLVVVGIGYLNRRNEGTEATPSRRDFDCSSKPFSPSVQASQPFSPASAKNSAYFKTRRPVPIIIPPKEYEYDTRPADAPMKPTGYSLKQLLRQREHQATDGASLSGKPQTSVGESNSSEDESASESGSGETESEAAGASALRQQPKNQEPSEEESESEDETIKSEKSQKAQKKEEATPEAPQLESKVDPALEENKKEVAQSDEPAAQNKLNPEAEDKPDAEVVEKLNPEVEEKIDPEVMDKLDQDLDDVKEKALASEPVVDENQKVSDVSDAIEEGEQNQR